MVDIARNLLATRKRIAAAAGRAGRDAGEVTLLAVSKTVEPARIEAALAAGVEALGESRVQEASEKMPHVDGEASWHFIGPLQRNKARIAGALFDAVHSVDRPALIERLAAGAARRSTPLDIYVQVNLAAGQGVTGRVDEVVELCRTVRGAEHLQLAGLMTMPPYNPNPEASRPIFRRLRRLREEFLDIDGGPAPLGLSMGMSADFEVAIEEGATIVRVGTAIFGARRR